MAFLWARRFSDVVPTLIWPAARHWRAACIYCKTIFVWNLCKQRDNSAVMVEIVVGFLEKPMFAEVRSDNWNLFCSSSVLWIRRWTYATISRRTDANHIARPVGLNSPYLFPDINSRLFLSFSLTVAHSLETFLFHDCLFITLFFFVFLRPRAASIQHLLNLRGVHWRSSCSELSLFLSWLNNQNCKNCDNSRDRLKQLLAISSYS